MKALFAWVLTGGMLAGCVASYTTGCAADRPAATAATVLATRAAADTTRPAEARWIHLPMNPLHWLRIEEGQGEVRLEEAIDWATLDMDSFQVRRRYLGARANPRGPASPPQATRAQMITWRPLGQLRQAGDTLRIAWDMQLLQDTLNMFYNGLAVGDMAGKRVLAAEGGRKDDSPEWIKYDFKLTGAPEDTPGRGTLRYHYELTITLEDAKDGRVGLGLRVWKAGDQRQQPEAYADAEPVAALRGGGTLEVGKDLWAYFWVLREDNQPDTKAGQSRGKIGVGGVWYRMEKAQGR